LVGLASRAKTQQSDAVRRCRRSATKRNDRNQKQAAGEKNTMSGLLQKTSDLVLGNLHSLLDAAIDLNSIPVCEQQIRRLNDKCADVRRSASAARADVAMAQSALAGLEHQIEENTANAQLLLDDGDPSNDGDAQTLMEQVVTLTEQLDEKKADLEQAQKVCTGLETASKRLSAKATELTANVNKLKSAERRAKSNAGAASALRDAGEMLSSGGPNLDNVAARIARKDAVASQELTDALASTAAPTPMASVTTSKAAALIAQMKAKKAGGATA
jgi:phage shock protein A